MTEIYSHNKAFTPCVAVGFTNIQFTCAKTPRPRTTTTYHSTIGAVDYKHTIYNQINKSITFRNLI